MELKPIIVDNDGVILAGNQRYRALQRLGYVEVADNWIKYAKDLTETEKKRFQIQDNAHYGSYDWDEVTSRWEIEDLIQWGVNLPVFDDEKEEKESKGKKHEVQVCPNCGTEF